MQSLFVTPTRIQPLNDLAAVPSGSYMLYWMENAHRVRNNPALVYAVERANEYGVPLFVCAVICPIKHQRYTSRQLKFLWEGLQDVRSQLEDRGIGFAVRQGDPANIIVPLAGKAAMIVCDRGYFPEQVEKRKTIARHVDMSFIQVDSNLVVPLDQVSNKPEYAARTIRKKINRQRDQYLILPGDLQVQTPPPTPAVHLNGLQDQSFAHIERTLKAEPSVPPVHGITGGQHQAEEDLDAFLKSGLNGYASHSNQPWADNVSRLSKYLHFGQISPVKIAAAVRDCTQFSEGDREAFLEQLIVRRELAYNFVHFNPRYDSFEGLPAWAVETLQTHSSDVRAYHYTMTELEDARTHDPYWNAAMREMLYTGYMHNYMRMYWGKKVLEWSPTPEEAFDTLLALNNKYFIDGWDPNSYAGVGWIFGLHDHPWQERPIFGKVRYMSAAGLKRKANPEAYIEKVESLIAHQGT